MRGQIVGFTAGGRWLLLVLGAIAFTSGFLVQRTNAQPFAFMTKGSANTSDTTATWPAPGGGSLYATQGTTWVAGNGALLTPGNSLYNNWVESSARREFSGLIANAEFPVWWVYARARYEIKASVTYNPTTPVSVERHRAETTLSLQAYEDVLAMIENRVVVDNTATTGATVYDITGAGGNMFLGAGLEYAEDSPGTAGTTVARLFPELTIDQWISKASIHFFLQANGKQYIHNNEEEDAASIATYIHAWNSSIVGFEGFVVGYDYDFGTGQLIEAVYVLGDGLIP